MVDIPPSTLHCTSHNIYTEFKRTRSSGSRSIGIRSDDIILAITDEQHNCVDPHLGHSEWDLKLGNVVFVSVLYVKIRWKWDGKEMMSIYSGACQIYTPHHSIHFRYPWISVHLPSLLTDILGGCDRASLVKHLESVSVQNWRLQSSGLDIHLESVIDVTERCTWRSWSSKFCCRHLAGLEKHLEAVIKRDWRCTTRLSVWSW